MREVGLGICVLALAGWRYEMKRLTYQQQLLSPRWQKRRLEMLEKADWICQECGDETEERQLHIHHSYYDRHLLLWEYPDDALFALCADCHEVRTEREHVILRELHGWSCSQLNELWEVLLVFGAFSMMPQDILTALRLALSERIDKDEAA